MQSNQGSLKVDRNGDPPNPFGIPKNQNVMKFICSLHTIITMMLLAPKVFVSNWVIYNNEPHWLQDLDQNHR